MLNEYVWDRFNKRGYEVSSKGDKRFSAFYAKINGKSIEEIYQCDIKGYPTIADGKGKKTLKGQNIHQLYEEYLNLWKTWAKLNPKLIQELKDLATSKILTDMFASSPINQARALADILNHKE